MISLSSKGTTGGNVVSIDPFAFRLAQKEEALGTEAMEGRCFYRCFELCLRKESNASIETMSTKYPRATTFPQNPMFLINRSLPIVTRNSTFGSYLVGR